MPTSNNTVPLMPDGQWQVRNMKDIFTGPSGTGQYVPNVGDEVHEFIESTKTEYLVASVDPTTLISTFTLLDNDESGLFPANTLFGAGPGPQSSTFRLYIDASVTPSRMAVDKRCWISGEDSTYAKIFVGTDISAATGVVISAVFDSGGTFVSENVSLELAGTFQGHAMTSNVSIRLPQTCSTHATLADGQICTIVFFDASGVKVSWRELMVVNSGFVRSLNAAAKEVISIGLETPFLAAANSSLINYPVNVPINALNLVGVVNYSDGTTVRYAVDGTRFSVAGLDAYAPTIVGQVCPIVLKYVLQQGEEAYGNVNSGNNAITAQYSVVTQAATGAYAVKLYAYPVWINPQSGYTLTWRMLDLARSINYDVTPYVTVDTTQGPAFSPLNYGALQTLSVYVDLADVNAVYSQFYHVQELDIVLNNPATTRPAINAAPDWQVAQTSGTTPMYGKGVYVKYYAPTQNSAQLNLQGDFTTYSDWFAAYYSNTFPLYNPQTESGALVPTHFVIAGVAYPVSQWNSTITLNTAQTNNATLMITFIQRTSQTDLVLSVAGVPMRQTDALGSYL